MITWFLTIIDQDLMWLNFQVYVGEVVNGCIVAKDKSSLKKFPEFPWVIWKLKKA